MTCTCYSFESEQFDFIAAHRFQECLFTWKEQSSFYIGMTSLLFWILCQLPQFVKNYQQKNADALAGLLLAQWLCGDTMNFFGSILTRQLAFQKLSAALFVLMDITMISQKVLYSEKSSTQVIRVGNTRTLVTVALAMIIMTDAVQAQAVGPFVEDDISMMESCEPNVQVSDSMHLIGNLFGWISSCFYVGSRIAQIYTNKKRQSTEGIASTMFFFAIMGNLTYSIGILLRSDRLVQAAAWLVGSLICMSLDVFIVFQSQYYKTQAKKRQMMVEENDGDALTAGGSSMDQSLLEGENRQEQALSIS